MSHARRIWTTRMLIVALLAGTVALPVCAGIPEPGITLYGKVLDSQGGLATEGRLVWTYAPAATSDIVTVAADLRLIEGSTDVFSYAVRIPARAPVAGVETESDALLLRDSATAYIRSVTCDGSSIAFDSATSVKVALADRGTVERIDLFMGGAVSGDVDLDNRITAMDIQSAINVTLGIDVGGMAPLTDANNDGIVNAIDIQMIINRALGVQTDKDDQTAKDDQPEIDDNPPYESDGPELIIAANDPASPIEDAGEETAVDEPAQAAPIIEGTPVAGVLGLGLAAAACALIGITVSNRKR